MDPRPSARVTFRFGEFEFDTVAYELRRKGRRLRLARQPMDLLLLLLERPRELVSRNEIAARLWSDGVFVDLDAGIRTAVLKIRRVLNDPSESPRFVETVTGKGYRFIAAVEIVPRRTTAVRPIQPEPAGDPLRHNLPSVLTSFVGRSAELAELRERLKTSRLLSLTGAGGVGKTRLAIRLVSEVVDAFPGGVWLIDLAALPSPGLIEQATASVLGVRESPQRPLRDTLIEYVRDRKVLLLFDTCEHVVERCSELLETLMRAAPALRVVATSRESLRVLGETAYRVPSLSLPGESSSIASLLDSDAGRLFVDRATAADPAFNVTSANAGAIGRICHRLDGIPLAIELAAARVTVLGPDQIEARLEDRFRLLTSGSRTAVPRHRTLEATVEWSVTLLTDPDRRLLHRLAVFPASWTLEAAEQICSGGASDVHEILDRMARLVDKSLVTLTRDPDGQPRYHLLDTVRDYAGGRLDGGEEIDSLRESHFAFFLERFRDSQRVLRGPHQLPRLRELWLERENVRAALRWGLVERRDESGVELAGALYWYWTKRGLFAEGESWLRHAVTIDARPSFRTRAIIGLAHMHYFQGRAQESATYASQAVLLGRENGDFWAVASGHFGLALAAFESGDIAGAAAEARSAIAAADLCGDIVERGGPLMVLANVALVGGQQDEALRLYDESIDVTRQAGEAWGLSILLAIAAGLRIMRGDFGGAHRQGSEALALSQALDDERGMAWSIEVFAGLAATAGRADEAARLWGASDALLEKAGGALTPTIGWSRERYLAPVKQSLGDAAFEQAMRDGRARLLPSASGLSGE